MDEQGKIIHANTTATDRLGYTQEELAGLSVLQVYPPDRRDEVWGIFGEILRGVSEFCPVPVVTKSGLEIPVETRFSSGFWDGSPAIFGVTKDISKLRLSEEKFSKLFHFNPSACGLTSLDDGKYFEVNEAFYSLLGFDKGEVIGKTPAELGILTAESINAILLKAHLDGNVTNIEADLIAKNGDIKHVLLSSEDISVQEKKFRYTVVQDVTLQKQTQESLKQVTMRLALAASAGGVGVWDFDLVNNTVLWDDQMFELYGIDKERFSGAYEAWMAGIHPDDAARANLEIQMAASGEKDFNTEFRVLWPDGTTHHIRALAMVQRDASGKPIRMVGTNWDITAQKHAEQALRQNEESLRKINVEKDKFFSIIAHDLRGPFNGFLGLTQILEEELHSLTLGELQEISTRMRNSATSLFRLLENLLEWSRMKQELISFSRELFPLLAIVHESTAILLESAKSKAIEITYDIPEGITVFADPYMLQTIIRNLVSNAVKFTHKGGKIAISAKTSLDGNLEISITDTGIGMDSMLIDNLFRLDAKTSRKGTEGEPSTGLGLIICKDFIEKHGGNILVRSMEGQGSTFQITLPASNS
jgi:PAS domain S-box-containing protein